MVLLGITLGAATGAGACGGVVELEDGAGGAITAETTSAQHGGTDTSAVSAGSGTSSTSTSAAESTAIVSATSSASGVTPSPLCQKLGALRLSNPVFGGAGGDGLWGPGETATYHIRMTNTSSEDIFEYPGIGVTTDLAGVTGGGEILFAILAGGEIDVPFFLDAGADLAIGTNVTVTLTVTSLSADCAGLDDLTFVVTLLGP
jgi:hypothetical protein